MTAFRALSFGAILALTAVLSARSSEAANILVTDESPTGFVFAVGNFEQGFSVNGTQLGIGLENYPPATVPSTANASFTGSWTDGGLTPTTSQTIYFVNPANTSQVLDAFSYQTSTSGGLGASGLGTISGTITSYVGMGTFGTLPSGASNIFPANGMPFNFSEPFLTGTFASAVAAAVPEPASLVMAGTGILMVLGYWLRRPLGA